MLRLGLAGVVVWMLSAGAAAAEDWFEEMDRTGWYVGASGVVGQIIDPSSDEILSKSTAPDVDGNPSGGLKLFGGYRVLSWLAPQATFEWIHHELEADSGGNEYDGETLAFTGDLRLIAPAWRNLEAWTVLGVGVLITEGNDFNSEESVIGRFGGGFDIYLTREVALTMGVSYVLPETSGDLEDTDYIVGEAGFTYRF